MRFLPTGIELPDQFGDWILRRRVWILLAIAVLTAVASLQLVRIPVQTSLLESFVDDPADFNRYRRRAARFGGDSDDLVYIATQEGASLFTPATLNAIRAVARRLEQLPEVARVTCLTDGYWVKDRGRLTAREVSQRAIARRRVVSGTFDLERKRLGIDRYWPEAAQEQTNVDLVAMREAMLRDERTAGLLLSADGSTQIMVLELTAADDLPLKAQTRLRDQIEMCVRQGGLGRTGVYLAGLTISQGWMFDEVGRALRVLFPIGLAIICATVYVMFQRLDVVVMTAAIGLVAIVWAVALSTLVFGKLSVLVAAVPLLILVLSTSDVIHLANAYKVELGRGLPRTDALKRVMREVGGACILTSVTTFVGFISLLTIPAPSTRHLALAAAVGVASALLLALTVVPISFSFLPPLPTGREGRLIGAANRLMGRIVDACQYTSLNYSRSVILVCTLLLVAGLLGTATMRVDIDYGRRFARGHPLRVSMDFFNKQLAGTTSIEVFLRSDTGSLLEPRTLRALAELEDRLKSLPEVTAVHSISMLYRLADQILRFPTKDRLPETRSAAHECMKLFRQIDDTRVNSMIVPAADCTRISVQLRLGGLLAIARLAEVVDRIARETLPGAVHVETSGSYTIVGRIVRVMVRSQLIGIATCFLSISLIMILALRSIRVALLAQIPNIIPVVLVLGILAVTYDVMDIDMLGIPTVALGLAVDDTIHFLHRYRLQTSKGQDRDKAVVQTFSYTGRAILQTTWIICLGLLPFALSSFLTVWMLGTYLVLTLIFAVLGDLLLLPAMVKTGIMG